MLLNETLSSTMLPYCKDWLWCRIESSTLSVSSRIVDTIGGESNRHEMKQGMSQESVLSPMHLKIYMRKTSPCYATKSTIYSYTYGKRHEAWTVMKTRFKNLYNCNCVQQMGKGKGNTDHGSKENRKAHLQLPNALRWFKVHPKSQIELPTTPPKSAKPTTKPD